MFRSVIAVTAGVLLGVTVFIYGAFIVSQMTPGVDDEVQAGMHGLKSLPLSTQFGVIGVWFVSTFLGAAVASLAARRWAPVSWILASTMGLFAVSNFASDPAPLWMQALSIAAIAAAGWLAIKVTSARYGAPPAASKPRI